ncbi:anthranilate synthase component I [Pasteurellaceae bacterium HPA106]|uniref:anthranilate synthase component I n=1 Tax=Spirabiliibacterium pneumoniae TaxID=221400 RepID=UPI001AACA0F5|nr:anthranilate synthase component I [Spirabiliibacterium pneumoniae]MBE2896614.1 anthranilate synthase component I [Spirabiliibacterium pneumoniae]
MTTPILSIQTQQTPYCADPTAVFAALCQNQGATLLLESAEIQSKNSLTSLLFVQSAVKIACVADSVTYTALNANGEPVLAHVARIANAQSAVRIISQSDNALTLRFIPPDDALDEDAKLQAPSIFSALRFITQCYANAQQAIYLGGLFSYDVVTQFIPMEGIELNDDGINCPDYCFYLADQLLIFDHQNQRTELKSFCFNPTQQAILQQQGQEIAEKLQQITLNLSPQTASTEIKVNIGDDAFKAIINQLKEHIYAGDVFQIVPSRRFSIACPNALASYRQLKKNNPSPYMFYMQDSDFTLFGASPESALKFTPATRQLEIYPIAGSRPRGFNAQGDIDHELDARLELELRLDKKELSEHLMLVDLARNDIARVCNSGSRRVAELMQVDRYSHIMHLVSRVVGTLRDEFDALHAYQACMNMGTLTGAPKIKAMQLLYQVEKHRRHSYGGAVGYLTSQGDFDTCIVIRSAFVQNNVAYIQAGCGEVLDSDPQMEADETRHKAKAVLLAIAQTNEQGA